MTNGSNGDRLPGPKFPFGRDVAFTEVVENDDAFLMLRERSNRMGTDVAGAPGHKERGHVRRAPRRSR